MTKIKKARNNSLPLQLIVITTNQPIYQLHI
nr:MAG TPA_asm: hypothetical protein [Caudoviricetes sp.]